MKAAFKLFTVALAILGPTVSFKFALAQQVQDSFDQKKGSGYHGPKFFHKHGGTAFRWFVVRPGTFWDHLY